MFESFESEMLQEIIDDEKNNLSKLINDDAKKYVQQKVQKKIINLQNHIMPIVLSNSVLVHHELSKHCVRCYDAAIKADCNALLMYYPIKADYLERPKVGIYNPKKYLPFGTPEAMQIDCTELEIINLDGNKVKAKPINIDIDLFM